MKYEEIKVGMSVFKIGDYHIDKSRVKLLRGKVVAKEPNKRTLVDWTNDRGETYEESQNIFPTIGEAVDDMNEWLVDIPRSLWHKMERPCPEVEKGMNAICSASWTPIKIEGEE